MLLVYSAFLLMVCLDMARHPPFFQHYATALEEASQRVRAELLASAWHREQDEEDAWTCYWLPKVHALVRGYPVLTPAGERVVFGVQSLGEHGAIACCAASFRYVLETWDATHALALPRTRRVFEVFAYDMERLYHDGQGHQLVHLFDRPPMPKGL